MRITIVCIGRIKEKPLRVLIDEYYTRIRRYTSFEEIEIADHDSAKLINILERSFSDAFRIALDVIGRPMNSVAFSQFIERNAAHKKGHLCFILGGADGIDDAVLRNAQLRLSMSEMTFPHRMARLMLAEQIYRAMTISRKEPYGLH